MSRLLYPLSVDLRGKPVLVAGGGPVAARKLTELLRCGADITVVDPHPSPAVERLETALRLLRRPFQSGDELGQGPHGHRLTLFYYFLESSRGARILAGGRLRGEGPPPSCPTEACGRSSAEAPWVAGEARATKSG